MSTLLEQPAELITASLKRVSTARGELAWVVTGQAFSFCGSFFLVKFLTSTLGPLEYGKLAFGITLAGVLQLFLYGPLGQAIFRYLSVARERAELPSYLRVLCSFHKHLAVLVILAAIIAAAAVAIFRSSEWALVVLFAILYGLSTGIFSSFAFLQNALRQRRTVAFHQALDPWLRAGIAALLIALFHSRGYIVLIGFLASAAVLDVSQLLFAARNPEIRSGIASPPNPEQELRYGRELLSYASPYLLAAGINSVALFGDRWTLQYLYGTGQLGIYAALCQIANAPVSLISNMVMQLMMPIIFQRAGTLRSQQQQRQSRRLLLASIGLFACAMSAVGIGFALFGKTVVVLVSSPEFAEYHGVLWIIFVGMVMFQLGQQATILGQIHRRVLQYLPCYMLNAVSTVLAAYFLGRRYGMPGVAGALLVSNTIYFCSVLIVNRAFEPPLSSGENVSPE